MYYFLPLKLITLSIPGSVFLVSIALLIDSLRRRAWRLQHSAHSLQDPSGQAHTRALKSLVSFLVLYTLSFMSLIIDAAGFCSEWLVLAMANFNLLVHIHPSLYPHPWQPQASGGCSSSWFCWPGACGWPRWCDPLNQSIRRGSSEDDRATVHLHENVLNICWIILWAFSFGKERRGVKSGNSLSIISSWNTIKMWSQRSQRASIIQKGRI